jgi:hypothetical protein
MAGRRGPSDRDPDDWFADSEGAPETAEATRRADGTPSERRRDTESTPPALADDWIHGDETSSAHAARLASWQRIGRKGVLAAAALVGLVLLIGLAVGGVFNSSHHRPPAISTRQPATTATVTQPTPTALPAPPGSLTLGDHGSPVRVLQLALKSLGYNPGTIDGRYGPKTAAAVTAFQRASRLTPDGILGPRTLRALRAALKSP